MAKNPFVKLTAANRASAAVTNRDRTSDFKVTQKGLDAIVANMLTTQGGTGRSLSKQNAKAVAAMGRISDKSTARLGNITTRGQNQAANLFGSVVGGDTQPFAGANKVSSSQAKVNAGQVKAGELSVRAGNDALGILSAASGAAANSAQYELAQALGYRAKNDAELIASNQLALASKKLDYKLSMEQMERQAELEWEMFRKQQTYQKKQLEKASLSGLGLITDTAPGALFDLQTAMMDGGIIKTVDAQGNEVEMNVSTTPPGDVAAYLIQQNGLPPEAMPVMVKAVTYMQKQKMDPGAALTLAMTQLYGDTKGWEEASAGLDKTIALGVLAAASTQRATDAAAAIGQGNNPFDLANPAGGFQRGISRIASWLPGGTPAY